MVIAYQAYARDLSYEQYLLTRFGGHCIIKQERYLKPDLSNVRYPKKYEGLVLGLFDKVKPIVVGKRPKRTKTFVYGLLNDVSGGNIPIVVEDKVKFESSPLILPSLLFICYSYLNNPSLQRSLGCFLKQDYAGFMDFRIITQEDAINLMGRFNYDMTRKRISVNRSYDSHKYVLSEEDILNSSKCQYVMHWNDQAYYNPSFVRKMVEELTKKNSIAIQTDNVKVLQGKTLKSAPEELWPMLMIRQAIRENSLQVNNVTTVSVGDVIVSENREAKRKLQDVNRVIIADPLSKKKWLEANFM